MGVTYLDELIFLFCCMLFILSFQCESWTEPPSKVTDIEIVRGSVRICHISTRCFPSNMVTDHIVMGSDAFQHSLLGAKKISKIRPKAKAAKDATRQYSWNQHNWRLFIGSCAVVNCCPTLFFIFVYVYLRYLYVSETSAFSAEEGANAREGRPHKLRSSRATDVTVFLHVFDTSWNRLWAVSESIPEVVLRIFNIVIVCHSSTLLSSPYCFHLFPFVRWSGLEGRSLKSKAIVPSWKPSPFVRRSRQKT